MASQADHSSAAIADQLRHTVNTRHQVRWVDIAKAIGISLMVFGHVWRGMAGARVGAGARSIPIFAAIDLVIYSFHMPLFFFLSGLFIQQSVKKSSAAFFGHKLRTIAYPYALWSILQCLAASLVVGYTNSRIPPIDVIRGLAIHPYMQFWFLYVLMLCMAAYWLGNALGLGRKGFFAAAVLAHVAGPWIHLAHIGPAFAWLADWYVLYEWRANVIYFAAGALAAPALMKWTPRLPSSLLTLLTLAGLTGAAALAPLHDTPWSYATNVLAAYLGILAICAAAIALSRRPISDALVKLGNATLPIFAAHVILTGAARVLLQRGLHINLISVHLIVGFTLGLFGPIALNSLAIRLGVPYLFDFRLKRPPAPPTPAPISTEPFASTRAA